MINLTWCNLKAYEVVIFNMIKIKEVLYGLYKLLFDKKIL